MIRDFLRPPTTPVEVLADLVRVAGLLSVPAAALWWDATDAGILAFTLPGLLVPRFLGVRPGFDIFIGLTLLVAAWSNVLDLYTRIPWWDIPIHIAGTGAVAMMAYLAASRWDAVPAPTPEGAGGARIVVMTTVLGLALSAAWEMVEWLGHTFISDQIYVAYGDTIADMAFGALGAAAAGLVLTRVRVERKLSAPDANSRDTAGASLGGR